MSSLRVLLLTPWALRVPRHGGQIRGDAVAKAYSEAGHRVFTTSLYDADRTRADEVWPNDVPIMQGVIDTMRSSQVGEDVSAIKFWECVAASQDSFDAFVAAVKRAKPEILQFEEPFLWPVVRRLRAEGVLDNIPIVHSSYNFETTAWYDLKTAGASVSAATLRDIALLEQEIATTCHLVITVSENDAKEFLALGASNVCVAGNGTTIFPSQENSHVLSAYLSSDQ